MRLKVSCFSKTIIQSNSDLEGRISEVLKLPIHSWQHMNSRLSINTNNLDAFFSIWVTYTVILFKLYKSFLSFALGINDRVKFYCDSFILLLLRNKSCHSNWCVVSSFWSCLMGEPPDCEYGIFASLALNVYIYKTVTEKRKRLAYDSFGLHYLQ